MLKHDRLRHSLCFQLQRNRPGFVAAAGLLDTSAYYDALDHAGHPDMSAGHRW
jgi:hypothetical protein